MRTKLTTLDSKVGANLSGYQSIHDVISHAGFDFNIETVPCHSPEGEIIKDKFILRRTDDHLTLGLVGKRYNIIPIDEMIKPFHRMVKQYGAEYETAGIIAGGKKCWVSAVLPDTIKLKNRPEDEIQKRIMVLINNDGMNKNSYLSVANRIFCNNQIGLITSRARDKGYKISHRSSWEDQLDLAQMNFESAISIHKEFEYVANDLNSKPMSQVEMRGFTTQLLPEGVYEYQKKEKDKDKLEKYRNRLNVKREQIVDLFESGAGNLGTTRWDALNAVTEFLDHHNIRVDKNGKIDTGKVERRFVNNVISGNGNSTKQQAITLLRNVKKFPKVAEFS